MDNFPDDIKHASSARELAKHLRHQAFMLDKRAEFLEANPKIDLERKLEDKRLINATYYCMKKDFKNLNYFAICMKFDVPEVRLKSYCDIKQRALARDKLENSRIAIYKMADKKLTQKKISTITGLSTSNISAILRQRNLRTAAHKCGLPVTIYAQYWKNKTLSPKAQKLITKEDIVFR